MHGHQVLAVQQCSALRPWQLTLCNGPSHSPPVHTHLPVVHMRSTSLQVLLHEFPRHRRRIVSYSQTEADMDELEDTDLEQLEEEDLDALFEEYGEVLVSEGESRPVSSELDSDAESLACDGHMVKKEEGAVAVAMAEAANEVKAGELKVLCVKPLIYWARFFVIATAFSKPQVDAIGKRMRDVAEQRFNRSPKGDTKPNSWTLLDFGDVVVHIFLPKERAFYNLEEFYGNATLVNLPFMNTVSQ